MKMCNNGLTVHVLMTVDVVASDVYMVVSGGV